MVKDDWKILEKKEEPQSFEEWLCSQFDQGIVNSDEIIKIMNVSLQMKKRMREIYEKWKKSRE